VPEEQLELPDDFRDCIIAMHLHDVEFVLVGAHALGVHGIVRATGDIDLLYRQTPSNVASLCAALRDFGAPPVLIDPVFMQTRDAIIQIGLPPLRIDLLSAVSGVSFDEVWNGSLLVEFGQNALRVMGVRELLANKRASGRPKDLDDVRRLEAVIRGERSKRPESNKPTQKRKR
jgi:hypothetical protein